MLFQVAARLKTDIGSNNTILASEWSPMRLFTVLFERCHVGVAI